MKALKATDPKKAAKEEERLLKKVPIVVSFTCVLCRACFMLILVIRSKKSAPCS